MDSLYSGMSVGLGFFILCALLSFIWIIIKNLKKRMFSEDKSVDLIEFVQSKAEAEEGCKEQKVDIKWPVSIEMNNGIIKAETKDLSRSGAFIKCSKPLLPGEQFNLIIETPVKGAVSLKSVVIWSNSNIPEEKVLTRGMGIRFIQNKKEDLELLKSVLEEYMKA